MPAKFILFKTLIFLILALILQKGFSQSPANESVKFMFYNVENLFDIYDDTLKDDNEFLPGGLKRWNYTRYSKKINSLYKTIIAAGGWRPPEIIAFCEVENRNVIEDLIFRTYLSKFNFGIIHEDSPDLRGIDVCMIYQKDLVDLINYEYWIPNEIKEGIFLSRSVLYAKFRIESDTVHIIANHWPSRRGGALSTESHRRIVAAMVKTKVDSLLVVSDNKMKIIIAGDFNCSPDDPIMKLLCNPDQKSQSVTNLSTGNNTNGVGTYRYMGIWEIIDQILVSDNLLNSGNGLYTSENFFEIFKPDFLLIRDTKYPGLTPNPTYRGYLYQGGYSDHLPVLLELKINDRH